MDLCLVDKTEMFLELHSNSLVRRQCLSYVQEASTELIKYVEFIRIALQSLWYHFSLFPISVELNNNYVLLFIEM